ncbi:MAG: FeoB-associated Cys-rich membrane protein [Longicatena sp.]
MEVVMNNISTIIVGLFVAFVLMGIIFKMRKDKKEGKSSCGCKCRDCPSGGICHETHK